MKEAYPYLRSTNKDKNKPPLLNRIRFFIGSLDIFLSLPSRITKPMFAKFSYGIKVKTVDGNAYIVDKNNLKFYVPKKSYNEFLKLFKRNIFI